MKKVFLGLNKQGTFIEAEVNDDGTIKGFNGYNYIHKSISYDGNEYLSMCMWTHDVSIKGMILKSGEKLPLKLPKISKLNQRIYDEACRNEGFYCSACGVFHDSEQYYDLSYVILDSEVFCKDCIDFEQLVKPLTEAEDLFKAPDVTSVPVPKNYKEVETLFCDSSGLGAPNERALTKNQALLDVEKLMKKHKNLVAGITGIGKFQVYVTLWTKKEGV